LHDPNFNRFRLIHPCYRQTDRQTDRWTDGFAIAYSALSMLSRTKKLQTQSTSVDCLQINKRHVCGLCKGITEQSYAQLIEILQ